MKASTYKIVSRWVALPALVVAISLSFGLNNAKADVYVNGSYLAPADLDFIEQQTGVRIPDGRYWYDAQSGEAGIGDYPSQNIASSYEEQEPEPYFEDKVANSFIESGLAVPDGLITMPIWSSSN
ncbi:MAG: hypothetical protein WBP46_05630 [Thiolinea sp.]